MFNTLYGKVVRGRSAASPTLDPIVTAGAYSANDAVGDKIIFNGAVKQRGGSGLITGITILDKSQQDVVLKLFLFDQDFTAVADNAAFACSDADMEKCIGVIATGTYIAVAATSGIYSAALAAPIAFRAVDGRAIYGQLMTTGTPTYVATTDLVVKLHVEIIN